MKRKLTLAAILLLFTVLAALPAMADSGPLLDYNLSGPTTASWSMQQNPDPFYIEPGIVFTVYSTDLEVNGNPVDDIICFFDPSDFGGVNSVTFLPDLGGPRLYSGTETNPTMLTGVFTMTDLDTGLADYTLTVTRAPEPGTLLLLASGLMVLAWKRKSLLLN